MPVNDTAGREGSGHKSDLPSAFIGFRSSQNGSKPDGPSGVRRSAVVTDRLARCESGETLLCNVMHTAWRHDLRSTARDRESDQTKRNACRFAKAFIARTRIWLPNCAE